MLNYHMKLHYSQTTAVRRGINKMLNYHMKLHYSQTLELCRCTQFLLNYHMKLHYSQTNDLALYCCGELNYHMKLHYSQTIRRCGDAGFQLNYHMKLHYSQTSIFEYPPLHGAFHMIFSVFHTNPSLLYTHLYLLSTKAVGFLKTQYNILDISPISASA